MKTKPRQIRDDYLALVKRFALRPIRTEEEYDAAMKVVGSLAVRGEQDLTADEADYLDVLSDLVSKYEQVHYRIPLAAGTPRERLRYLVEQAGMSASDLGRLLGSRGLGANLLAEVIRQAEPDVVVCPEATDAEEFAKLAKRLGMDHFRGPNPRNPEGAVGVLVREPWELMEAVNHGPLDERLTRSAVHVRVRGKGKELMVIGVHLHARETLADETVRLKEWLAVKEIAENFHGQLHVLAGDFNAHHPEQIIDLTKVRKKTLERIAGQQNQIPREVVRQVLAAGYVDAYALGRKPEEFGGTLTTSHPELRTDYVFVPAAQAAGVKGCEILTSSGGLHKYASDHFPVLAEFEL